MPVPDPRNASVAAIDADQLPVHATVAAPRKDIEIVFAGVCDGRRTYRGGVGKPEVRVRQGVGGGRGQAQREEEAPLGAAVPRVIRVWAVDANGAEHTISISARAPSGTAR